jgi:hypothetical protein
VQRRRDAPDHVVADEDRHGENHQLVDEGGGRAADAFGRGSGAGESAKDGGGGEKNLELFHHRHPLCRRP